MSPELNVWVDIGGTFTDAILWSKVSPGKESSFSSLKVLSSGRTRCLISGYDEKYRFIVNGLPVCCRDFWATAQISLTLPSGGVVTTKAIASGPDWLDIQTPLSDSDVSNLGPFPWPAEIFSGLESPALAAHRLLDIPLSSSLPPLNVRLGTTRGTNALLTRTGAAVGLCITKGFGDLPLIGNQDRPNLFELHVTKPAPLCQEIVEVQERIDAAGNILVPLADSTLDETFANWKAKGIRSVAIALMHSYLNPIHEEQVAAIARKFNFDEVICSSMVSPVRKLVSRCDTTLVDAYLSPVINDYLHKVRLQLGNSESTLQIMTSAGSLVDVTSFRGKDSVLSGPAGGIVAVQELLKQTDRKAALAFDMGGTSTDVSRCTRDELPLQFDTFKAGVRIVTPILSIHTVAAGGGSICSFDGVQLRVGPASAGSFPGPACYGQGGPLTITDINLLLGFIPDAAFPFPIDRQAAEMRLRSIATSIRESQQLTLSDLEIASGYRQLANQVMADAIRVISTRQGADPREHILVGFGGAAGQHQCDLAEILEIPEILDPPLAGLYSAVGIGFARHRRFRTIPLYLNLNDLSESMYRSLTKIPIQELEQELKLLGYSSETLQLHLNLELRYQGTEATLLIPLDRPLAQLASAFHDMHQRFYGYHQPTRNIEACTLRLEAVGPDAASSGQHEMAAIPIQSSTKAHRVWHQGCWLEASLVRREHLVPGQILHGPTIVINSGHTTWIAPDWTAKVDEVGNLCLTCSHQPRSSIDTLSPANKSTQQDPIFRDLLGQRLAAIALSMGEVLEKTAISVNIKERRDFSCAIFDANGILIANAPHVPVHLGAMGQTVRELLNQYPDLQPNDCLLTNDPNRGGSHLPDITVVTPVFDPLSQERLFFVACRAHHAEIGGITAGSMPPTATNLEEEGVVLPPQFLVRNNTPLISEVLSQLKNAQYPSRSPQENIADLLAQQAANQLGVTELVALVQKFGKDRIQRGMAQILAASAERVRLWIEKLPSDSYHFVDELDDGSQIQVKIQKTITDLDGVGLCVDFSGTSPKHPRNFNANRAIVTAALLYVIRTMAGDDLPLNEGALQPIRLVVPKSMLSPIDNAELKVLSLAELPAVAAGNVETSQRIVDVLLGALQAAAASQGTMNNFLFGDSSFGYYETICGGTGATSQGNGCDAVHSHMTNTRITDPEVLEVRYPVRLREFSIRRGSGGAGEYHGGDGIVREIEFLRALQASLISSRRSGPPPYGLFGGTPGKRGVNLCFRAGGTVEPLSGTAQIALQKGDVIRIETPGGGGYGKVGDKLT